MVSQDIEEEVEKYGRVLNLTIPRGCPEPPPIPGHCNGVAPEPPLYLEDEKESEEPKEMIEGPKEDPKDDPMVCVSCTRKWVNLLLL